jgi:hypothetical protein
MEELLSSGIKMQRIENFEECKNTLDNLICCICLNVVFQPVECKLCDTVICEDCLQIMKIADKKCVTNNCKGNYKKANKFVREVLSTLIITCEYCEKNRILYKDIDSHLDKCEAFKLSIKDQLFRSIQTKDDKILELSKQVDIARVSQSSFNKSQVGKSNLYQNMNKEMLRNSLVTFNLNVQQKMQLYNCTVEGKVEEFKTLVFVNRFPVLEEVSAHNYFWTPFHYAMHYGQFEIVKLICAQLIKNNQFDGAMRLESNDGRCPLLCLLRSNALKPDKKKVMFEQFIALYPTVYMSPEVRKEIKTRDFEPILKKYNRL